MSGSAAPQKARDAPGFQTLRLCELHLQHCDEQVHHKIGPCDDERDVVDERKGGGAVHGSVHHEVPAGQRERLVGRQEGQTELVVAGRVPLG